MNVPNAMRESCSDDSLRRQPKRQASGRGLGISDQRRWSRAYFVWSGKTPNDTKTVDRPSAKPYGWDKASWQINGGEMQAQRSE